MISDLTSYAFLRALYVLLLLLLSVMLLLYLENAVGKKVEVAISQSVLYAKKKNETSLLFRFYNQMTDMRLHHLKIFIACFLPIPPPIMTTVSSTGSLIALSNIIYIVTFCHLNSLAAAVYRATLWPLHTRLIPFNNSASSGVGCSNRDI
ncbi:hypothetical protein OUZ56_013641 [Daphnia magna]|uniref:Uncharacterized protein n=1 Tax=Daphnia magna TaxID=35525 RepID=A0ABQ9Z6H7_9CRUS|nr:hypothetical protein OUZ56_013641 [Daphnia magna]